MLEFIYEKGAVTGHDLMDRFDYSYWELTIGYISFTEKSLFNPCFNGEPGG